MYYERITKQLIIAEQLHQNGHSLQAFLLLYHLLRWCHITEHCNYNVQSNSTNKNITNNEGKESEYHNDSNKIFERNNSILCPCFPAHLIREEVLVRVHAVEYLLAAKPTYTEFSKSKLLEASNKINAMEEAQTEKLRLALKVLQPLFTCCEFSVNEIDNNDNINNDYNSWEEIHNNVFVDSDINELHYLNNNLGNEFIATQEGNNSSNFFNSITVSAVVWQTSAFTLQLPLSTTQSEESIENDLGIYEEYSSNSISKPNKWWNVQIGPALSAVRVPLGLIVQSYILRAKCQIALKELNPNSKISWQCILNNLQGASQWISLSYNSVTLHHNREDLLDELCERVQSVNTSIIDNTSQPINNNKSKSKQVQSKYQKEEESEIEDDMNSGESNDLCCNNHYTILETFRSDVDDKLNVVLERERVYCNAVLSLECCIVICKQLNELRVKFNKVHLSTLHQRQKRYEHEELLPILMKYRSEYKTCVQVLYTHAANYTLLKWWLEMPSSKFNHYIDKEEYDDDTIQEMRKEKENYVNLTGDAIIRSVLHSGSYSAMCLSDDFNRIINNKNRSNMYWQDCPSSQCKSYSNYNCSVKQEIVGCEILYALEEYYHWSITLLKSCSSVSMSDLSDYYITHEHKSLECQWWPFTHSVSHITRNILRSYLDLVNYIDQELNNKYAREQQCHSFTEKCTNDHIYRDSKQCDAFYNDMNDDVENNIVINENKKLKSLEEYKYVQKILKEKAQCVFVNIDHSLVAIKEMKESRLPTVSVTSNHDETEDKHKTQNGNERKRDLQTVEVITTNPCTEIQILLLLKSCTLCTLSTYNIAQCNIIDAVEHLCELQQFCSIFHAYTFPLLAEIHILLACLALQLSIRNVEDVSGELANESQKSLQSSTTIVLLNTEQNEEIIQREYSVQQESINNYQTEMNKMESVSMQYNELEENAACDVGIAFAHLQAAEHILLHESLYCNYSTLVTIQLLKTLSLYLMSNRGEELHVMHFSRDNTEDNHEETQMHDDMNVLQTENSHKGQITFFEDNEQEEHEKDIINTEVGEIESHPCKRTKCETFVQCTHVQHSKLSENDKERQMEEEEEEIIYKPIPATRQLRTSTLFTEMLARITQQYIRHATEQLSLRLSTLNVYDTSNLRSLAQITFLQEWCIQVEEVLQSMLLRKSTDEPFFQNKPDKSRIANIYSLNNVEYESFNGNEKYENSEYTLELYHDHIWTQCNVVLLFLLHGLNERDEEKNLNCAHYYFTRAHYLIASMMKQENENNFNDIVVNGGCQYLQLLDMIIGITCSSAGHNSNNNKNYFHFNANKICDKLQVQLREMCKRKTLLLKLRSILSFNVNKASYSHNHRL